jgi:hypothetical protein
VNDARLALPKDAPPETLNIHVETLWHLTAEEIAKTDSVERKATALASLAGFVVAVNGAFGLSVVRSVGGWPMYVYVASLGALLAAVGFAALAIRPATHAVFGADYIRGLESPDELRHSASAARLKVVSLLIERILEERNVVCQKKGHVVWAFYALATGLILVVVEATGLAGKLGS